MSDKAAEVIRSHIGGEDLIKAEKEIAFKNRKIVTPNDEEKTA